MKAAYTKHFLASFFMPAGFLAACFITASQPVRGQDQAIPLIQMQDVRLDTAIENLARQADLNFILDPKLTQPTHGPDGKYVPPTLVSFRWENLIAKEALARLLTGQGLRAVESPASSVTRIISTNQPTYFVDKAWVTGGTNAAIPLIQMQDGLLDLALTQLAARAQLTLVLDPKLSNPPFVSGKPPTPKPMVSMRWQNLTARQAIAALCENYNLGLVEDAATGGVRIAPK